MATSDLDRNAVESAYARWAPIYHAVCGQVMVKRRRAAASAARAIGGNILEVGIAAAVERWPAQRTRNLGLRPEFPFARLQAWAQSSRDTILMERRKVAPFGLYTPVCFERTGTKLAA